MKVATENVVATLSYQAWHSLLQRCYVPTNKSYKWYGARGIRVADEWRGRGGYERICEHIASELGPKPEGGQIDRINNARGYEPGNIKWSTSKQNNNNRRDNRHVTVDGSKKTAAQWADERDVPRQLITNRLARGWDAKSAVTAPYVPHATRQVTFQGKTQTLQKWSDELHVPVTTLRHRLDRGADLLDAVQPVLTNRLLEEIRKKGTVRPTELAREMGEKAPTINAMLHIMARDGLVKKLGRGLYTSAEAP